MVWVGMRFHKDRRTAHRECGARQNGRVFTLAARLLHRMSRVEDDGVTRARHFLQATEIRHQRVVAEARPTLG